MALSASGILLKGCKGNFGYGEGNIVGTRAGEEQSFSHPNFSGSTTLSRLTYCFSTDARTFMRVH